MPNHDALSVEFLAWDTEFFGQRIARITATRLTPPELDEVLRWCEVEQIDCLYFLADPAPNTITLAERTGFHLVDVRILLQKNIAAGDSFQSHDSELRQCCDADIPLLRQLAASSYQDTRFYNDSRFPSDRCDEFYATWIEKACHGYEDVVLVSVDGNSPTGFITGKVADKHGTIGLVGVAAAAQGQGIGKRLLSAAMHWFSSSGAETVSVVTQGSNVAAQRLYQSAGFRTHSMHLWYHRWFDHA